MTDLPVSLSVFREASDPYWKFVTLNIKKDMGEIIVVVLVLYVFCKIVRAYSADSAKAASVMINNHCSQLFTHGNSKKV